MARIDSFLRLVVEQQASDLHFHAGSMPMIRHDGELAPLPFRVLTADEARRFLLEVMTSEQRACFERDQELDFAYAIPAVGRFRVNVMTQQHGPGAVFRVIPQKITPLADLGFPAVVRKLVDLPSGLALVTGPTGSGKTTTLAAIVQEINRTSARHVITIEDPIEYVHTPARSVVTQRQVGLHAESFSGALRSALREAPDVLVVGELRDYETVSLALSAAETGVLVFGTLHTSSAAKAVDRIIDVYPEDARDQARAAISVLLRAVVAQQLCKRASGEGRVALVEVLLRTYAVAHMIRDNKVYQIDGYLQSTEHAGTGTQGLDTSIFGHLRDGTIALDQALRYANNPDALRRMAAELPEDA